MHLAANSRLLALLDTDFKLLLDSAQKMLAGRQLSLKVPDRLQVVSTWNTRPSISTI